MYKRIYVYSYNIEYDITAFLWSSESPHSEPGTLDEVDNGPNTSDEGEQPITDCSWSC